MPWLNKEALENLKNYKYKSGEYSFLDKILNHYWNWLANLVPPNVAPNVLTLIGLIFMVFAFMSMLAYDYTISKDIPSWTFYSAAACAFIYQSLDAIDGKQARKTGASGPLGQLFDHGCDSFSMTFFLLTSMQALKLGDNIWGLYGYFVIVAFVFWTSNWSEYHTKVLETQFGNFGVTEAQTVVTAALIFTGYMGQSVWDVPTSSVLPLFIQKILPHNNLVALALKSPIKYAVLVPSLFFISLTIVVLVVKTLLKAKKKRYALRQNIPIVFLFLLQALWFQTPIYEHYRGPVILAFGLHFSLVTAKMITAAMSECEYPIFHKEFIVLCVVSPLLLQEVLYPQIKLPFNENKAILTFVLIITLISVLSWAHGVIKQITEFLKIDCFSLGYLKNRKPEAKKVN